MVFHLVALSSVCGGFLGKGKSKIEAVFAYRVGGVIRGVFAHDLLHGKFSAPFVCFSFFSLSCAPFLQLLGSKS